MKVRPTLPDDFFDQGFTPHTDPFQLQPFAEGLTKLFGSLQQGTVSILDGRWGSGKTVFAKQWKSHLEGAGIPAIYFDAFASDYIQDPFQAISAAFIKASVEAQKTETDEY